MHRKATGIHLIAGAVAALLLGLIVIGILTGPAKGKVEEYGKAFDDAAAEIGDWGCTAIKDPVDFKTFMEAMYRVYDKCANKGVCGSGKGACEKMTLDLGDKGIGADGNGDGTYYKINHITLKSWGFDMFNNYYVTVWSSVLSRALEGGANIYCKRDNADTSDYEIDAHYSGGSYTEKTAATGSVWRILSGDKNICIEAYGQNIKDYDTSKDWPLFSVADGSKVTIKATKDIGTYGTAVDLKISVNGGKFEKKISAPLKLCDPAHNTAYTGYWTGNTDCATHWAKCTNEQLCDYNYCSNNNAGCKGTVVTCTLNGDCFEPGTTNVKAINCAPTTGKTPPDVFGTNTFEIKVLGLVKQTISGVDKTFVKLEVKPFAGAISEIVQVEKEKEVWIRSPTAWEYSTGLIKSSIRTTKSTDKDAKLSVAVTTIKEDPPKSGKYEIRLLQGCY